MHFLPRILNGRRIADGCSDGSGLSGNPAKMLEYLRGVCRMDLWRSQIQKSRVSPFPSGHRSGNRARARRGTLHRKASCRLLNRQTSGRSLRGSVRSRSAARERRTSPGIEKSRFSSGWSAALPLRYRRESGSGTAGGALPKREFRTGSGSSGFTGNARDGRSAGSTPASQRGRLSGFILVFRPPFPCSCACLFF